MDMEQHKQHRHFEKLLQDYTITTTKATTTTPTTETATNESEFHDLYKSNGFVYAEKQQQRREDLLAKQKSNRTKNIDSIRSFEQIVESLKSKSNTKKPKNPKPFHNYLQLSEWLREKPADWPNWFLVPCPKGMRCILIATDGMTKVYNKRGHFIRSFRSRLPGDHRQTMQTTIFDCFYVEANAAGRFYVLDVMAYADRDMQQCDAAFRFFWLKHKIEEEQYNEIDEQNEFPLKSLEFIDCAEPESIDECLARYPMWSGNQPELDGLLFYHKDAFYMHGQTPLVGWLFPFMIPEVLGDFIQLNQSYLNEMPSNYIDYLSYINEFDRELKVKRNKRLPWNKQLNMDADDDENRPTEIMSDVEVEDICKMERNLEMDGIREDDIYYNNDVK